MSSRHVTAARSYLLLIIFAICFALIALDRAQVFPWLREVTTRLYGGVALVGAVALLLGMLNVGWVHIRRIQAGVPGWVHSLLLVAVLLAVFVAGAIDPAGTAGPLPEWIFDSVIAPGQLALFSLLAFTMGTAAYRFLRLGRPGSGWLLAGSLLMLVVQAPSSSILLPDSFGVATAWLLDWPVMAALRGVLLGSSLALLVVGLRLLIGRS